MTLTFPTVSKYDNLKKKKTNTKGFNKVNKGSLATIVFFCNNAYEKLGSEDNNKNVFTELLYYLKVVLYDFSNVIQ